MGSFLPILFTGLLGHSVNQARDQKKAANEAAKQQQAQYDALAKERQDATATENNNQVRDQARKRQRSKALSSVGTRKTVLTSPLGLIDQPETNNKTLLGA